MHSVRFLGVELGLTAWRYSIPEQILYVLRQPVE